MLLLALRGKLDIDIIELIVYFDELHRYAVNLQRVARGWLCRRRYAHTRHALWLTLERELEECSPGITVVLMRYAAVRQEWKIDPAAWLFTLRQNQGADASLIIHQILKECIKGIW